MQVLFISRTYLLLTASSKFVCSAAVRIFIWSTAKCIIWLVVLLNGLLHGFCVRLVTVYCFFQLNAHLAYSFIVSNPFVILHANIWFLTFQWASMWFWTLLCANIWLWTFLCTSMGFLTLLCVNMWFLTFQCASIRFLTFLCASIWIFNLFICQYLILNLFMYQFVFLNLYMCQYTIFNLYMCQYVILSLSSDPFTNGQVSSL